ncbi:MAG: dolichyl-phosphate beta-D-mannosyltransferase [Bdellovibrionales bacterium RIFCSPHIGHO2_01_FULL_40_29]|nr:MAG: dolichyl-phosphate beta-D-mannosyltransferase [Bdellovibrionales bacterium RIFCSPHIGHO2_01_FULL_40_29]OFZ34513.1 MAG: dolichyl-phosphate beta-D-mannosyltransferase [Bdellovibrionales bacterium RIFCSPHIGHO2_02_FULL_40_15]
MKKLVIVPTYNEIENIKQLLPALMQLPTEFDVLVVDDSSPDGTADEVLKFRQHSPRVNLLKRTQKNGLGQAYIAGFKWGLQNKYDAMIEMDADFSHSPQDLIKILEKIETHPVVLGSRYVSGGKTVNWGFLRKLISRGGGVYSRLILGYPIRDWTGGFNGWQTKVLQDIGLDTIQSNGYSFQIELKYKAQKYNYPVLEVPITFEDRRVGQSKMSLKIVLEAFYRVWLIRKY